MPSSIVTASGQITLPRDVREALGATAGDQVDFVALDDGYKLVVVRQDIRQLRGRFAGRVGQPVSIDDMEQAIATAAGRRERS